MTDEFLSAGANPPRLPDATESNLDRLLARMQAPDEPDPDFVRRVGDRLVREARLLAAERRSRLLTAPGAPRWRRVLTVAAGSLAGALILATALWPGGRHDPQDRTGQPAVADTIDTADDATGDRPVLQTEPEPLVPKGASAAGSPVAAPGEPRVFSVVGPEGAVCVSYNDIDAGRLADPTSSPGAGEWAADLPPRLRILAGRRIRIRGFMVPAFEESGLRRFVLSRDNEACCFGPNPRPCDVIPVTLRAGTTTNYIEGRPFDVVGTFHVEPEAAPDGTLERLYVLHDALVVGR